MSINTPKYILASRLSKYPWLLSALIPLPLLWRFPAGFTASWERIPEETRTKLGLPNSDTSAGPRL